MVVGQLLGAPEAAAVAAVHFLLPERQGVSERVQQRCALYNVFASIPKYRTRRENVSPARARR